MQVAATPVSSPSFVFRPGALRPDTAYTFLLNATDFFGTAVAQVSFRTAPAPQGAGTGRVVVSSVAEAAAATGAAATRGAGPSATTGAPPSPAAGAAYSTVFTLSAVGYSAAPDGSDSPLSYQFAYLIDGTQMDPVIIQSFQPNGNILRTTLPQGVESAGYRVTIQLCANIYISCPLARIGRILLLLYCVGLCCETRTG